MAKMIFVNLPVANLDRSVAFYKAIGAEQNLQFTDETASAMRFSDTIVVMILTHEKFSQFTPKKISDAHTTSEVLIALSADSREEVDETVARAGAAGGRMDPGPKQDHGFMYGRSFEDPDGHIFEVVWMNMEAATQNPAETADA